MPKFTDYEYTLDYKIHGIPCKLAVTECLIVPPWKGSIYTCPSDLDYYGYEEVEYVVLDRKGYRADWLSKKMNEDDDALAISFILENAKIKEDNHCYD